MKTHLDIGSSPPSEPCAQLGRDGYYEQARRECRAYINQLRRMFGPEPPGARLGIRSNEHDFGIYLSVVCHYDTEHTEAIDYAHRCESDSPLEWDDEARIELGL